MLVVTSPDRYEKVLGDLREHKGSWCGKHRLKQAQRAFAHTANYDGAIAIIWRPISTLGRSGDRPLCPKSITFTCKRSRTCATERIRISSVTLYVEERLDTRPSVAFAKQLHGKELCYINLLDADAALCA